jgi:hopanoid biosynthesis associated protein HpnK
MKMKRLIVNGDDFGLTPGVNRGIGRAHREGILTSATLMANAAAFQDAVNVAAENPGLAVGCHLVLVGGQITGNPAEVGPLAGEDGRLPATVGTLVGKITLGQVSERHIAAELRAQIGKIQRACRLAGIEPTHCDTHKHTHCHPVVMRAMAQAMAATGMRKWRRPYESPGNVIEIAGSGRKIRVAGQTVGALAAHLTRPLFDKLSRRYGLRAPGRFYGFAATGNLDAEGLRQLLEALPDGVSELMCHPGENDEDLRETGTRLREQRAAELAALVAEGLRDVAMGNGIELISYAQMDNVNGRTGLSAA